MHNGPASYFTPIRSEGREKVDILELLHKAKVDLKPLLSTLSVNKARLQESSECQFKKMLVLCWQYSLYVLTSYKWMDIVILQICEKIIASPCSASGSVFGWLLKLMNGSNAVCASVCHQRYIIKVN